MATIATPITGTSGTKMSPASTCRALAARAVGPPQGVRFITPLASIARQVMDKAFIFRRRYSGSIDATTIM